jgi:hypothetical protein
MLSSESSLRMWIDVAYGLVLCSTHKSIIITGKIRWKRTSAVGARHLLHLDQLTKMSLRHNFYVARLLTRHRGNGLMRHVASQTVTFFSNLHHHVNCFHLSQRAAWHLQRGVFFDPAICPVKHDETFAWIDPTWPGTSSFQTRKAIQTPRAMQNF